jgi:general secretion pathway protein G
MNWVRQKAEGRRQKAMRGGGNESVSLPTAYCFLPSSARGFTLIELVITVAVLAILTMGVIPLVQVSVKRQKEQQLREELRQMREAIDQFHREALAGAQYQANQATGGTGGTGGTTGGTTGGRGIDPNSGLAQGANSGAGINPFADARVRVFITDQTIFTADNVDRYPPDLDTLVKGVDVLPITAGGLGRRGNLNYTATEAATADQATPKTKVYLRSIPIDPMTGKADWVFRSCYDSADSTSWGGENVFDVRSASKGTALNGEKYSDW